MIAVSSPATALRLDVAPRTDAASFRRQGEPVTLGVPLRKDLARSVESVRLVDGAGRHLPMQASVGERWADGSIRWLLVRFLASTDDRGRATYTMLIDPDAREAAASDWIPLRIDRGTSELRVHTGAITATIAHGLDVRTSRGGACRLSVHVFDRHSQPVAVAFTRQVIEEAGLLYARVRLDGNARLSDGDRVIDLSVRLEFFAGLPAIRCALAVTNPWRARHRGGIWDLGDPNSVRIRGLSVRVDLADSGRGVRAHYSVAPNEPWQATDEELTIYQESSGGSAWSSRNHVNADGIVPLRFQGYRLTAGSVVTRGLRATPIVQVTRATDRVGVTTERFWENFPRAIRVSGGSLALDLFPTWAPDLFEIQPGERKTHRFTLLFGDDPISKEPLAWARAPLLAQVDAQACLAPEPLPFLVPFLTDPTADSLLMAAIDGPHSFFQKREHVDEYGWRHFGDLHADHETANSKALISHYNNQYDAIAGFATQYLRTADARWWSLMDDLATHVVDIDIYHTSQDKAAYAGGLFWHTYHYVDAGRSTHRSYPSAPGVNGGGPSNEHNYSTGLMLHHLLTGSPESREAALGLAEWVIAMDEGRSTPFKWLARGSTGLASSTASTTYHGPGRGAGNSISVLLNAHRLSDDERFLRKAEELIARCISPSDDIEALQLLDAERRWSYTVFLQALGRYLLHKVERKELDEQYARARASLLHYARWMTEHEYPYLDKPEILEYPTETWAAQDLRKAEVFILAALCSEGDEQQRFVARAEFFHAHALRALHQLGTWWLTRPLVILMSTTGAVPWWRERHQSRMRLPDRQCAQVRDRPRFVPQRLLAMRRAKVVGICCVGAAFITGVAAWLT